MQLVFNRIIARCPFFVTDDLVFMLEAMGLNSGVNLDRLLETRTYMESCLKGEVTRGAIAMAGVPKGF